MTGNRRRRRSQYGEYLDPTQRRRQDNDDYWDPRHARRPFVPADEDQARMPPPQLRPRAGTDYRLPSPYGGPPGGYELSIERTRYRQEASRRANEDWLRDTNRADRQAAREYDAVERLGPDAHLYYRNDIRGANNRPGVAMYGDHMWFGGVGEYDIPGYDGRAMLLPPHDPRDSAEVDEEDARYLDSVSSSHFVNSNNIREYMTPQQIDRFNAQVYPTETGRRRRQRPRNRRRRSPSHHDDEDDYGYDEYDDYDRYDRSNRNARYNPYDRNSRWGRYGD